MIWVAIGCFAIAAILGGYLLSRVLTDRPTPKGIAIVHGLLAATGLVLLVVYNLTYTPAPVVATLVFGGAALGGFVVFGRDITKKTIPKWLAVGHGLVAVTGFAMLLIFADG